MLAYSFQEKNPPTCFYLRAFYRQAAPNFAYSFIKFEEKIPAYSFVSAYLFIRVLRVHYNGSCFFSSLHLSVVSALCKKKLLRDVVYDYFKISFFFTKSCLFHFHFWSQITCSWHTFSNSESTIFFHEQCLVLF